jgi:hypothetical protein
MDRADKIFTVLALALMIGVLVHSHRPRTIPGRVNVSSLPWDNPNGPAYLVSNLPLVRHSNDYDAPVSIYEPRDGRPD